MIVDDNPVMRQMIHALVRKVRRDSVVFEFGDGAEAVRQFEQCRPELVLMDVEMPVMDGLTAIRLLRHQTPQVRFVVVSQYDDEELQEEAARLGATEYIHKDNLAALEKIIRA